MKKLLFSIICLIFSGVISAQTEQCGTMQNLEEMMIKDPSLKFRMDSIETETQQWIKNNPNSRLKNYNIQSPINKATKEDNNGHSSTMSLCGYNNIYYTTIAAPTTLNQIVSPSQNCTYGGEYVRVTGLIAGKIYRISTCGVNNFDTQLSIYTTGGYAVAHNDDFCGSQSEILFNPIATGTYDVLIDQYDCTSNGLCASLQVELIYTPRPVVTIPVVVHVFHYGEPVGVGRNISNAQIQSQIDVLNEDFRRLNTDIYTVDAAFRGVSDDPLIQFCLAQQDEFGNPTNGIDRWTGINSTWDMSTIESVVKPISIWDRDKYLNLWTLEFGGADVGTLGYAQFPSSGAANTDGVVVLYNAFGTTGTLQTNYALGRTCSHEVGHWLNLRHIWADDSNTCDSTDFIFDTPNQSGSSSGCQTFPVTDACSPNYPGIMFMNIMDYGYHQCRRMFTFGQAARMEAALFNNRTSLLTSQGCSPSTVGINSNSTNNNISLYPNPSNGNFILNFKLNKEQNISIEVLNIIGEVVFRTDQQQVTNGSIFLDISNQTSGIYFIHFNTPTQRVIKKMVVNKSN